MWGMNDLRVKVLPIQQFLWEARVKAPGVETRNVGRVAMLGVPLLLGGCNRTQLSEEELAAPIKISQAQRVRVRPTPEPTPTVPPIPKLTAAQQQILKQAQQRAVSWASAILNGEDKASPNPNGLVVAEPQVASKAAPDLAALGDFGDGCGRWLHLNAAGQAELGGTPLWGAVDDARRTLKRRDARFSAQNLAPLARILGVSHIATGTLTGREPRLMLEYRVWKMPQQKPVGEPLRVSGTRAQIVTALPSMARDMARRAGVRVPQIAAQTGITSAEMALLGAVAWKAANADSAPIAAATSRKLEALAARVPLAGLLFLRSGAVTDGYPRWNVVARRMLSLAPKNALVIADIAWQNALQLEETPAVLETLRAKYPHNYLLATSAMCRYRVRGDRTNEHKFAVQAVVNAPRNAGAWLELGDAMSNEADDIRQRRYIPQLSRAELRYLNQLYPHWLQAGLQATRLDPLSGYAWSEVAVAASFNGQDALADAAYWRSVQLEPHNPLIVGWGLQMFQPKWQGDRQKLLWVARRVETDPKLFDARHQEAMQALLHAGLPNEGQALLWRAVGHYENRVRVNPKDAAAHLHFAYIAKNNGDKGSQDHTAIEHFEAYLKLRPDDARAHYDCGYLQHYKKRTFRKAEMHYRRALQLWPDYADALNSLGDITYYVKRDAKTAEKLYRRAIANGDNGLYHVELGRLLLDQGQRSAAMNEARRAVAAGYTAENDLFTRLQINADKMKQQLSAQKPQTFGTQ